MWLAGKLKIISVTGIIFPLHNFDLNGQSLSGEFNAE